MHLKREMMDEPAMLKLAGVMADGLRAGDIVFFMGPLGAGKTTVIREMLRSLGCTETITSPTYAMVEEYALSAFTLYHFDGYRMRDAQEWVDMGLDDYLDENVVCIVEWPESGRAVLPKPTMSIAIGLSSAGQGRDVKVTVPQPISQSWADTLMECLS